MDATYTAEQLREDAHRADGIGTMADGDQLRAHADLLDWKARIEAARSEDVREVVRKLRLGGNCLSVKQVQLDQEAADLLESLSVKLAELEAELKFWKDDSKEERCRAHDANRRAEKAEAEVARLKAHAEAMSRFGETGPDAYIAACNAYRRDFGEEK